MKVLIRFRPDAHLIYIPGYRNRIESLDGEIKEVITGDRLRPSTFYIRQEAPLDALMNCDVIFKEDVEIVYDDERVGRTFCKNCGNNFLTGLQHKCINNCNPINYKEFFPGTRVCSGMDSLINDAIKEIYEGAQL